MTPERLDAIRADVADVEWRAGRIAAWKAMPHPFAVESGLRTQGLRAPRLAADLRDLLAEVERLQAEVERLKAEIQPRIERSIAFQDAMEEAEMERDEARAEVERLREVRQRGCDCNDEDACRFARERDEARAEVERLKAERDAAHRAGQEAMRERCAALCDDWEEATYCAGWREMEQGAQHCAEAIRAMEVEL